MFIKIYMVFPALRLIAYIIFANMALSTGNPEKFQHVSKACNSFSTDFYQGLSLTYDGNIISSSFGLHTVLSLLSGGANGSTKLKFEDALHSKNLSLLREDFKDLIPKLNNVQEGEVKISNAVFSHNSVEFLDDFLSTAKKYFHSDVLNVDFHKAADSVKEINSWVHKKTNSKISHAITENDISEYTVAVLINAVYFKCDWLYEFDPANTKPREFHISKSEIKNVASMLIKKDFIVGNVEGLQARFVKIPYKNEAFEMVILVPDEVDGLKVVEGNLNFNLLSRLSGSYVKTELIVPKFKFEMTMNLKDVLSKLNLGEIFTNSADFSKISEKEFKVDEVYQKVFIEVNEKGCEAGSATVVSMREKRSILEYEEFVVDRPFLFFIMHKLSNIPLFGGRVTNLDEALQEKDEL